jgi:hypothetical protein
VCACVCVRARSSESLMLNFSKHDKSYIRVSLKLGALIYSCVVTNFLWTIAEH